MAKIKMRTKTKTPAKKLTKKLPEAKQGEARSASTASAPASTSASALPHTLKNLKSTKDIAIQKHIIGQVIGQEEAVNVVKKASLQRRHVLLIGEPGTGKSMLGLALAELLPKEKLVDILAFPNPNDENQPLIRTVPAGQGRNLVSEARIQANALFKNQNLLFLIIAIAISIIPYFLYSKKIFPFDSAVVYAASMITGIVVILGVVMFMNLGKKMGIKITLPKVIVDNYDKKEAPFLDATGGHAGALLGDVLHDPFQTFFGALKIQIVKPGVIEKKEMKKQIDELMTTHEKKVLRKENIQAKEQNYEAVFLDKNELKVVGEKDGEISPVRVLSTNRYDYKGTMIKLTTTQNKELMVTPEHKIAVSRNAKTEYIEAAKLKGGDEIITQKDEGIIDEQDIINTYDERQQEQCKLYYQYRGIKEKNPAWGYKRIAKMMGERIGKTRWWNAQKHTPTPIQTTRWLKERGLLPLKLNHPKLPQIAKILGATFGDGGVFENLNGMFLSSSEKEAVEEFARDLEEIASMHKNENGRIIEAGEYGHSWCYQNTNRNIIRFFLALGAPKGNKTKLPLKIPGWISLQEAFEDEFFGSFFGGELGTPIMHKAGNYLTCLELGITGFPVLKENRLDFLKGVTQYLNKRGVTTTSIYQGKTKTESLIFRLLIEKKIDNVLLFMINTKLNYCTYKKERLLTALGQWAMTKKKKYHELLERGYGAEHAMKTLHLSPQSLYLLLNHFGPEEVTA